MSVQTREVAAELPRAVVRVAFILSLVVPAALPAQQSPATPLRPKLYAGADTNDARLYYQIGVNSLDDKPAESVRAFYWASKIDPSSAEALYALHTAKMMAMTPDELGRFLDFSPRNRSPEYLAIDSLLFRAFTLNPFLTRTMERRIEQRSIEANFVHQNPHVDRARLNDWILARMQAMRNTGQMEAADGRLGEALAEYAKSLRYKGVSKDDRDDVSGYIHAERAMLFYRLSNLDSARAEMIVAVKSMRARDDDKKKNVVFYISKAMYQHLIGLIDERLGDVDGARQSYANALEEDLSYYGAHRSLAQLDVAKGDTANALLEMDLAVELQPNDAVLRYGYAKMLVTAHRDGDAAAQLMKSIAADPYYPAPHMLLARIADLEQYTDDAVHEYQQYVALSPTLDPQLALAQQRLAVLTKAATTSVATEIKQ
jgi:tetratricopeptide (TPR) repeat protein